KPPVLNELLLLDTRVLGPFPGIGHVLVFLLVVARLSIRLTGFTVPFARNFFNVLQPTLNNGAVLGSESFLYFRNHDPPSQRVFAAPVTELPYGPWRGALLKRIGGGRQFMKGNHRSCFFHKVYIRCDTAIGVEWRHLPAFTSPGVDVLVTLVEQPQP